MKRKRVSARVLFLLALSGMFELPGVAQAVTFNIVTDDTWAVSDSNDNPLGNAQEVCLSPMRPANCPATAIKYGYQLSGWSADLSTIAGAKWIWARTNVPGATAPITGETSPAAGAEFVLKKQFYLCGEPRGGRISVAADDGAEVFLNGSSVSVVSSMSHATLTTVNVPASALRSGPNLIKIKVGNGPNPPDCPSGQYRCNPAGVVLGASFEDALDQLPTCTSNGQTFEAGQRELLSCNPGEVGSKFRYCVCFGSSGEWAPPESTCRVPPATCTGNDGRVFAVDEAETLSCPSGQEGSASRTCQANGSWGPVDSSACTTPPVKCNGNDGSTFDVGAEEMLACPSGQNGSAKHTCQSDGNWGTTDTSGCVVQAGGVCGSREQGQTASCPVGTTCGSRLLPSPPRPWYCVVFGISCPVRLRTADWFCD